jgi:hypothetical protein
VSSTFSGGECIAQSTSANRCIEKPASSLSSSNYFPDGPSTSPIWLSEVTCLGNEQQLLECRHGNWGMTNCRHKEDVGCRCRAPASTVAALALSTDASDEQGLGEIADLEQSSGDATDFEQGSDGATDSPKGFAANFLTSLFLFNSSLSSEH